MNPSEVALNRSDKVLLVAACTGAMLFGVVFLALSLPNISKHPAFLYSDLFACIMGGIAGYWIASVFVYESFSTYRWYRKLRKGTWYHYRMSGELPGCYGTIWTRQLWEPHRYYNLIGTEHY
jgi:hypothetical protein